jgi:hypothetical protein
MEGVIVAVKVTGLLTVSVEGEALTVVVVEALLTVWGAVPEPAVKLPSPAYAAVIVYEPVDGSGIRHVAVVMLLTVFTLTAVHRFTDAPPLSV